MKAYTFLEAAHINSKVLLHYLASGLEAHHHTRFLLDEQLYIRSHYSNNFKVHYIAYIHTYRTLVSLNIRYVALETFIILVILRLLHPTRFMLAFICMIIYRIAPCG